MNYHIMQASFLLGGKLNLDGFFTCSLPILLINDYHARGSRSKAAPHIIQSREFQFSGLNEQFGLNMPGSKWYLRFVSTRNYTATSTIGDHTVWLADHNNWQRSRKDTLRYFSIRQFIKIAFIHADSRDDCFLARRGSIIDARRVLAQTLVQIGYTTHVYTRTCNTRERVRVHNTRLRKENEYGDAKTANNR